MMPENTYEDRFDRTFAFIDFSGSLGLLISWEIKQLWRR
ncbi:MAG: hypothetical protein Ct9H90mP30_5460 [Actinomycetota bacterium]|nr:MAG: hypothetical protein Ct9H90mP30_5460 [Actinomycetota bacterium]